MAEPWERSGRRMTPTGPDRLPSEYLAARARMFAVATSKKGGPANKPVYGTGKPPAGDDREK